MSTRLDHAVFILLDRETVAALDAAKLNLDTIATASTTSVFSVSGSSRDQAQSQITRKRRFIGLKGSKPHLYEEDSMDRRAVLVEGKKPQVAFLRGGYNVRKTR